MKCVKIFCLILLLPIISVSQSLTVEKTDEGAWIKEDGENVLFYQAKTKSKDGQYARANYIHPLFNVDGFELSEDFPKDHLHHRGIFWTWHQVIIGDRVIGDAWECKDFTWDVRDLIISGKSKKSIMLHAKTNWKSKLWKNDNGDLKPFVEENAMITVYARKDSYRVIDFEISLLALEDNVRIGGSDDHKGYGGFSVRMKMPKDIMFKSNGRKVVQKTEQVSAGSWMDVSGTLASNEGKGGVIIMCHPSNPMYPEKWILRKKGSMQNPVYPGRQPVIISTTTPTVLKYRLVVYVGEIQDKTIEDIYKSY